MGKFEKFKKSFFAVFRKKDKELKEPSVFENYISESSVNESEVSVYEECAKLCEEALRVEKQKQLLYVQGKNNSKKINNANSLGLLSELELEDLKELLSRYVNVIKERNILRYQLEGFDSVLRYLARIETEARFALPKMENAEVEKSKYRHDLAYLTGEKEELEEEKSLLEFSLKFLKIFNLILICAFAILAFFLAYLNIFKNIDIFMVTSLSAIFVIIAITFSSVMATKIKRDIRLNVRKQQKAVSYINKKNVVFAYHVNFLRYECDKFRVSSTKHLKILLDDLSEYKKLQSRTKIIRRIINDTEEDLETFLFSHNISNEKRSLLEFAETIDIDEKKESLNRLLNEKDTIVSTLDELESKQNDIWNQVEEIRQVSEANEEIVSVMMKVYYNEVNKNQREIDKDNSKV